MPKIKRSKTHYYGKQYRKNYGFLSYTHHLNKLLHNSLLPGPVYCYTTSSAFGANKRSPAPAVVLPVPEYRSLSIAP